MREAVFTLASYFRFLMISGAIYNGEPQNVSAIASGVKDLPKQSQPLHTKTKTFPYKENVYNTLQTQNLLSSAMELLPLTTKVNSEKKKHNHDYHQ